jgi:hypothetical protein
MNYQSELITIAICTYQSPQCRWLNHRKATE